MTCLAGICPQNGTICSSIDTSLFPGFNRQPFNIIFVIAVRLLVSHKGEPGSIPVQITPGFSKVRIVLDYAAGRLVRRVFSGISRFPRPCIPALLQSHLILPSSALNTSLVRATFQFLSLWGLVWRVMRTAAFSTDSMPMSMELRRNEGAGGNTITPRKPRRPTWSSEWDGPLWEPRVHGQEARERYGRHYRARLVPRRSYAQGEQCFRRDTVLHALPGIRTQNLPLPRETDCATEGRLGAKKGNSRRRRRGRGGILTADAGVVGNSDAAVGVVGDGSDLAGAPRAVLVVAVVARRRVVVVVVDVAAGQRVLQHQHRTPEFRERISADAIFQYPTGAPEVLLCLLAACVCEETFSHLTGQSELGYSDTAVFVQDANGIVPATCPDYIAEALVERSRLGAKEISDSVEGDQQLRARQETGIRDPGVGRAGPLT
ncbi:hypothetical protein PR048_014647 [Dryococelus australis]|uniref:Uncharacterized protein n=1 Tax=Dryococelus australis TaxID=614101 RepID=A0ABQ9HFL8_9NEOP|nr:hypothetical protein PR048_014647 [Dryococelus australis]